MCGLDISRFMSTDFEPGSGEGGDFAHQDTVGSLEIVLVVPIGRGIPASPTGRAQGCCSGWFLPPQHTHKE